LFHPFTAMSVIGAYCVSPATKESTKDPVMCKERRGKIKEKKRKGKEKKKKERNKEREWKKTSQIGKKERGKKNKAKWPVRCPTVYFPCLRQQSVHKGPGNA
jgi:hypothetical protein